MSKILPQRGATLRVLVRWGSRKVLTEVRRSGAQRGADERIGVGSGDYFPIGAIGIGPVVQTEACELVSRIAGVLTGDLLADLLFGQSAHEIKPLRDKLGLGDRECDMHEPHPPD